MEQVGSNVSRSWSSRVVVRLASPLVLLAVAACNGGTEVSEATSCSADAYEVNDTQETAYELPEMADDPDAVADVFDLTTHITKDEDWFRVHIRDTGLGGNPVVSVAVSSRDFELTTWFVCDDGHRGATECQVGSEANETLGDGEPVRGCSGGELDPVKTDDGAIQMDAGRLAVSSTECSGTSSDDGTLFIRVRRKESLQPEMLACSYNLALDLQ